MAFTTPQYGQDGSYTAAQDRGLNMGHARTPGVRRLIPVSGGQMQGDLAVYTTGTANGSVNIGLGDCFIDDGSGAGMYFSTNATSVVVLGPFTANSSGATRTDLVYVQVTDTGVGAPTIAAGVSAGSTTVPAKAIGIATVAIPNGFTTSTQVQNAWITDIRKKAQMFDFSVTSTTAVAAPVSGNLVFDTSTATTGRLKVYDNSGTWTQLATTTGTGWTNADMAANNLLVYRNTVSVPPSSPSEGQVWYQTDTDRLMIYDGAAWVQIGWGAAAGRRGFVITRAANQTLPFQALTHVSFDTELVDTDGFITVPSSTATIPAGLDGLYIISGWVQGQTDLGTSGAAHIYTQGSANQIATVSAPALAGGIPTFGGNQTLGCSLAVPLVAGDTIRMLAYQSVSSPSVNMKARLSCYRVGV